MSYLYPYGDTQQLNLAWFLAKFKELYEYVTQLDPGEAVMESVLSRFTEQYDSTKNYIPGDYCIHDGYIYKANRSTAGAFDSTAWDPALPVNDVQGLRILLGGLSEDLTELEQNAVTNTQYTPGAATADGLLRQTKNGTASTVMTVDKKPTANSQNPVKSGAVYSELESVNGSLTNIRTSKRITTIDDLSTSENKFVTFAESVSIGDITFPQYAKGVLVTNMGTDASLYAIGTNGHLYIAFRAGTEWRNGTDVTNEITSLKGSINAVDDLIYHANLTKVGQALVSGNIFQIKGYNNDIQYILSVDPTAKTITYVTSPDSVNFTDVFTIETTPKNVTTTPNSQNNYRFETGGELTVTQCGKIVQVNGGFVCNTPDQTSPGILIATGLPRPKVNTFISLPSRNDNKSSARAFVNTSGELYIRFGNANNSYDCSFTYIAE